MIHDQRQPQTGELAGCELEFGWNRALTVGEDPAVDCGVAVVYQGATEQVEQGCLPGTG